MSKLTKSERLARLQKNLSTIKSWDELDKEFSIQITQFEKEFGFEITGDYPLMRYQRMYDDWVVINNREQKQMNKNRPRKK